ncbi:MAG: GAF domain-containing protein [Alphaproteobacteria bacterium]|nr:GAF domain-containing protein [Alphaproteobacteria bacterium]
MTELPDLEDCAREPIRVPGAIQPHGALLVVSPEDFTVLQASANAATVLGLPDGALPASLDDLPAGTPDLAAELQAWQADEDPGFLRSIRTRGRVLQVSGHRTDQGLILEFEEVEEAELERFETLLPRIRRFLERIEQVTDSGEMFHQMAVEIRRLTDFNRVLIYRFDEEWNGIVVAEDGDGALPSYLDLRFPASDIPAQARELYRLNRLRLIPTATYDPVPMVPGTCGDGPLDMSLAALRSVSPIHREYMRNMGTAASMSISLLDGGRLWGLISCHHAEPKTVSPQVRAVCEFVGRIAGQQIGARERTAEVEQRIDLKQIETRLIARLSEARSYQDGLLANDALWMGLTGADGAAVVTEDDILSAGNVPPDKRVRDLCRWLDTQGINRVFATDNLQAHWPEARDLADMASGLIAVPISQIRPSFLLWFRPEMIRTVAWGGNPAKATETESGRIHPRKSFETWKQQVRGRSEPWSAAEVGSAGDFRNAIINFVLRRAEERAELTDELERTNSELEAFSYSVSHDLRAPFRHIVGFSELLAERLKDIDPTSRHYLDNIHGAALSAGQLVDDLLNFSRLGRTQLDMARVDMDKLVDEIWRSACSHIEGRTVEWDIAALPPVWGDGSLLRQALANLIDNALKYTRDETVAHISVKGEETPDETVFAIADNGVGFDMSYVGKLFGVFQRLHHADQFEGTGIGLALTKRIIDRHGGWIRAEGTLGRGATFTFGLPKR